MAPVTISTLSVFHTQDFFWILTCVAARGKYRSLKQRNRIRQGKSDRARSDSVYKKKGSSGISFFKGRSPWTVRIKGRYDSECGCQRRRKYHSQRCIQMHLKELPTSLTNKTVIRVAEELCHAKHKKKHARPQRKRGMNRWLHHRRQEQAVYISHCSK